MSDSHTPPHGPKWWYQKTGFVLLFIAACIIAAIVLILYIRGIDPVIAEFYIFN